MIAFQDGSGCPNPVPATESRTATPRPTAEPSSAPTVDEAKNLAQSFDDALNEGDLTKAYGMLSCVNLYEKNVWGTCSMSDLLAVGP